MLRNIKLYCDFDEQISHGAIEDPLLRVRFMLDRDLQVSARQILKYIYPNLITFYKYSIYSHESEFSLILNKAIMALFLAANPKNLIQNSMGKSSISYFSDFVMYLKEAFHLDEYQKTIAYFDEIKDENLKQLTILARNLAKAFFLRPGGIKEEMIGFIYRLIRKGEEKKTKKEFSKIKLPSFWLKILEDGDSITKILKYFPNGPLFKTLDIIRETEQEEIIFNPSLQKNYPSMLFRVDYLDNKTSVLKMPCPTKQTKISKSRTIEEFKAFLKENATQNENLLIVNLQNRNSWIDVARCQEIEQLQYKEEYHKNFFVVTLDKNSEFYYQAGKHQDNDNSKDFKKTFLLDFFKKESFFLFPKSINKEKFSKFIEDTLDCIHNTMYASSKKLDKKQRLDFIEIAYLLITIKLLEIIKPKYLSFVCKDSVDISPCMNAMFFAFVRIMEKKKLTQKDQEFLYYLFYSNALLVRERSVDPERFNRTISAIAIFEQKLKSDFQKIVKSFEKLFSSSVLKSIKAKEESF